MDRKILWIAQITRGNSFSKVSVDYIELIRFMSNWSLDTFDVSYDRKLTDLYNKVVEYQPTHIIILHNDNNFNDIAEKLAKIRHLWTGELIGFIPLDFDISKLVRPCSVIESPYCSRYLTMNEWAVSQLQKNIDAFGLKKSVKLLHHMVEDVYPLCARRKKAIREKFYGEHSNKFIIGFVNANNIRKRLDLAIHCFKRFNHLYPQSLFVIKTTGKDLNAQHTYFKTLDIMLQGVPHLFIDKHLSPLELGLLYNSFDLIINTTDGEGFGLTPFEAALAGTLSIVPRNTSFISLLPNNSHRYTASSTPYSYSYARSTEDIIGYLNGDYHLWLVNGTKFNAGVIVTMATQVDKMGVAYMLDNTKTINNIIQSILNDDPDEFCIGSTTDHTTLSEFLNIKDMMHLLKKQYSIKHTDIDEINKFVDPAVPMCGIVDCDEIVQKITYYYENPEILKQDCQDLQDHVKKNFNSEMILKQLQAIIAVP